MLDFLGEIFEGVGDLISDIFDSGAGEAVGGFVAGAATALLVAGVISVIEVTVDTIKNELSRRSELKAKGVVSVIVKEFLRESNATVVTFDAINSANQCVGKVQMKGSSVRVVEGQKISIA